MACDRGSNAVHAGASSENLDICQRRQFHKTSGAVTQPLIKSNTRLVKLTHEQIRHWRITRVLEVTSPLELPRPATNQQ